MLVDLDLTTMKDMKMYLEPRMLVAMLVLLECMIKIEPTNAMTFPVTHIIDLGHLVVKVEINRRRVQ
jgi:hypothetical protein